MAKATDHNTDSRVSIANLPSNAARIIRKEGADEALARRGLTVSTNPSRPNEITTNRGGQITSTNHNVSPCGDHWHIHHTPGRPKPQGFEPCKGWQYATREEAALDWWILDGDLRTTTARRVVWPDPERDGSCSIVVRIPDGHHASTETAQQLVERMLGYRLPKRVISVVDPRCVL